MIRDILGIKALNSRGEWTIKVFVKSEKAVGSFIVPSGKSRGSFEAVYLSVEEALRKIEEIKPEFIGIDEENQEEIDRKLIETDGTENKRNIGGNVSIGISCACCVCAAKSQNIEVFEWISKIFGETPRIPHPLLNLINGGKHAGNELSFQEFLIIPMRKNILEDLEAAVKIYQELKKKIKDKYGKNAINVGDEGGFAPPMKRNEEAIEILNETVEELGYSKEVFLGLDCAASSYFRNNFYFIDGKELPKESYLEYLVEILKKYKNIIYIEDPFEENDPEGFKMLKEKFKDRIIVGDDLFVTNPKIFEERKGACSGIIIKPNQVGTLTEAFETIRKARKEGYKIVVSHRSGDSEDPFVADLAVGASADFIKAGAPARGERTAKYNRLLEIFLRA